MKVWISLFVVCGSVLSYGQNIQVQSWSTSGGGSNSGASFKLSGAFGQPIITPVGESVVRLESGFMPVILAFSNNQPPEIIFTSVPRVPENKIFRVEVSDQDGVDEVYFHYRAIAQPEFNSIELTGPLANAYEVNLTADPTAIDALGIEYFFSATDKTGLEALLPMEEDTFFRSFSSGDGAKIPETVYNIGREKEQYRIIAIPYELPSGIGPQLSELNNEDNQHSKSRYRLATYAGNNSWLEYPSSALTNFERGKGYWFLTTVSTAEIFLENASTPENHQAGLFSITLKPDWNQIGNPYPVPITWSDVQAFNPDVKIKGIHIYKDKSQFENGDALQPFEGGFVFLDETTERQIVIPFSGQELPGGRTKTGAFSGDLSADSWRINLKLQIDGVVNAAGAIGMHPDAQDENDPFDDYHPPRFASYREINFYHPEHRLKYFATDIVEQQESHVWTFSIDADVDSPITLLWDNTRFGNNDAELFLVDESQSQVINMRERNSYPVGKNVSYKIYYGYDILHHIIPNESNAGVPYPNPWSAVSDEDIRIPFAIDGGHSPRVRLAIMDAGGRSIKRVFDSTLPSGFHELAWNGKDESGQDVPRGLYLIRLTLADDRGARNFYHRLLIR